MKGAALSQERLKSLLHYDSETGVFTHIKARPAVRVGSIAGTVRTDGYEAIKIDGKSYPSHRLAWLYVHGHSPPDQLDHINRVRTDNRLSNLRLATQAENLQNKSMYRRNTSGHVGVSWKKRSQKWMAYIRIDKKLIYLGYFKDLTEAVAARKAAAIKFHTFQHNHQGE